MLQPKLLACEVINSSLQILSKPSLSQINFKMLYFSHLHTQWLLVLHVRTLYNINKVKTAENQLVQACRDINMVHAYVNTPATAKLAIEV